jgi:hypothetical protein
MKTPNKKIIIRKDIKEQPTAQEIKLMKQYGQDPQNKCLDCGQPLYYFNQCDRCYEKMIAHAKSMY